MMDMHWNLKRKPWDVIMAYYQKSEDGSLMEEDKRLFVEGCEYIVKTYGDWGYKYSTDCEASLYNLACFYEEEGYERLAHKYFALYNNAHETKASPFY